MSEPTYLTTYFDRIREDLDRILEAQRDLLQQVADRITESVKQGGVVHILGAGHSQLMVEEVWYRAGQLACVHPLFDQGLWPHNGPTKGSLFERREGYARDMLAREDLRSGEVMFVVSNSGRNAVPVEAALIGKERGLFVVALTALAYSRSVPSRHSSGKRLFEVADVTLDNFGVEGEAVVELPGGLKAGASTTVTNAAILNGILAQVAGNLAAGGETPPVFVSANLEADPQHNQRLLERYSGRVPLYRG